MRSNEFITELRSGMMAYVKRAFPNMPDYVARDLIYKNSLHDPSNVKKVWIKYYGNLSWTFNPNFKINENIWDEETLDALVHQTQSSTNTTNPKHLQRFDRQRQQVQTQGVSREPIIVQKSTQEQGKYTLLEGWHRTVETTKQYPQGYSAPAYIGADTNESQQIKQTQSDSFWSRIKQLFKHN